ncbi:MAG: helix-turn-helix domain-containing protein [Opitutales bacterium]
MQTIGERLEEARKRKGVSIREAAEATKIRSDYLHKFESNQFDLDLAEIYVRGFLRTYTAFLRLPADKILNDYVALGRGDNRQRQPSREIYGRMEVSIASADERAAEKLPAPEPVESAPAEHSRRPAGLPRSGSSLPKGPAIPPTLIFRGGIILGAVIVLLLIVWGIKAAMSGDEAPAKSRAAAAASAPAAVTTPAEPTVGLVALNTVRVKVTRKNADGSAGDVLLPDTTMMRGEVRSVPKPGPILIWATEGKNLQVEINGKRYPMPFEGYNRAQIN